MTESTDWSNTVLALSGVGVPPYSARGLRQTLTPIEASRQMARTVNGTLRDFSASQFRKYGSTITGTDQQPPACDGVWPGQAVTVDCIVELAVQGEVGTTDTGATDASEALGRDHVAGSIRTESGFTFYRPKLSMRVTSFNIERDEWGAQVRWTMELEEV